MHARPASNRLAHVDSLRAVAALLVACAHLWERFLPFAHPDQTTFEKTWPRYFDFGITGVIVFFSISGFVIYGTLRGPREGAGRRFVVSRFFRLFPAYWASMVGGLIFIWWWQGLPITGAMVAGNATMLPTIFQQPQVMGLYWTLETELAFYLSCWVIWRCGWLDNPRVLAGLVVGMSLAWFAVKGATQLLATADGITGSWKNLPRHLGIMFWGAYFRIVYDESEGFRRKLRDRKFWILVGLTLVILAVGGSRQFRFFIHPSRSWFSPYVVGPCLFLCWTVWLRVRFRALVWLGQISYSIYLFHLVVATPLLVFVARPENAAWRGWPVVCYVVPAIALSILVSAGIYYAVERPAISLGRRLAGRRPGDFGVQAAP